jgi:hypothetical protein
VYVLQGLLRLGALEHMLPLQLRERLHVLQVVLHPLLYHLPHQLLQ